MSDEHFLLIMQIVTGVLVGATLGSFITMLSYRWPRKLSIVTPRSHCPSCKTQIGVRDLIPVFSFLASKGQCRVCNAPIGPRYLIIELISICAVTGILIVAGFSLQALALCFAFIFVLTAVIIILEKK